MKRLLGYLLVVTALIIGIGGVTRLVTYAADGVPFKGWLQLGGNWGGGGYAQVPYQDEIKLDPTNGSFTIEGWINNPYFPSAPDGISSVIYKKDSFKLEFNHYKYFDREVYGMQFDRCSSTVCIAVPYVLKECLKPYLFCPAPQGWFYFAYVYNQTTNKGALFWGGVMRGANEQIPEISTEPIVLQYANSLDELRISNNVRYTASFNPASAPFECDENTLALWHFDEIAGSTIFHDMCGAVDNMFVGYDGAHTEGVTGYRVNLPFVLR